VTKNEILVFQKSIDQTQADADPWYKKRLDYKPTQHIYVIGSKEFGWIKIGVSENPFKRIKEIQIGCPVAVNVLYWSPGYKFSRLNESRLHNVLSDLRGRGEWFKFDEIRLRAAFEEFGLELHEVTE
jgi:hypothetical protein